MELGELSALFRQWADVLDGKVEGVRAETMPDGRTVTSIDLPVQGLSREGIGLMSALAHLAERTHEADPPQTLSIRHVTSAPKAGSPMANGVSTTVPASPRGSGWRSGSEAKLHPTGYASALEAVMSSGRTAGFRWCLFSMASRLVHYLGRRIGRPRACDATPVTCVSVGLTTLCLIYLARSVSRVVWCCVQRT